MEEEETEEGIEGEAPEAEKEEEEEKEEIKPELKPPVSAELCKKIEEAIADEEKGAREYEELSEDLKDLPAESGAVKSIGENEKGHKEELERIHKKICE